GSCRAPPYRKFDLALEFAIAKQLHAAFLAPHQPGFDHCRGIDRGLGVDQTGIDSRLNSAQIDLIEIDRKWRVPKTALRHAAMERHLAAFESLDADAGSRSLTLAASTAGLPHAGTDAAANTPALFPRPRLLSHLVPLP